MLHLYMERTLWPAPTESAQIVIHTNSTRSRMRLLQCVERARKRPALLGWAKMLRWMLALVFIWPGLEKLAGEPFLRAANEPGLLPFFDTLHTTGLYWRFVGFCQVLAGMLLLFPRTALLGVLFCVPIYANIVALLFSLPFDVPSVVAGVILFGSTLALLVWYLPELASIGKRSPASAGSIWVAARAAWRTTWFRRPAIALLLGLAVTHVISLLA